MAVEIQIRRDTAADWTSANSLLGQGEWGLETDTDKMKIGDGSTSWNSLAYQIEPFSVIFGLIQSASVGSAALSDPRGYASAASTAAIASSFLTTQSASIAAVAVSESYAFTTAQAASVNAAAVSDPLGTAASVNGLLGNEIAIRKAPAFNLEDFGTVDVTGNTDMTSIMTIAIATAGSVSATADNAVTFGAKLVLPPGVIQCGDVPGVNAIIIEGAGDRSTTLLAKPGCTNVLNFQGKLKCYFRDFGIDSASVATYGINTAWSTVNTLTITATGGSYTLTWNNLTTSSIAWNAIASTIQSSLISAGISATVGGVFPTFTVTQNTSLALTVNTGSLTGGSATLTNISVGPGASTANLFERIFTKGALGQGLNLENNGDSYMYNCGGTDGFIWDNPSGNNTIINPKYFSANSSFYSMQFSAQNCLIVGGAIWGIQCIDTRSIYNLELRNVYGYAPTGGSWIMGPTTSGKIDALVASGGLWAVQDVGGTGSFFGGNWGYGLKCDGVFFNSAGSVTPIAFAPNFVAVGNSPLLIEMTAGSTLLANAGASVTLWNDKINFTAVASTSTQNLTAVSTTTGLAVGQTVQSSCFTSPYTASISAISTSASTVTINPTSGTFPATNGIFRFTAGIPNILRKYTNFVGNPISNIVDFNTVGQTTNAPDIPSVVLEQWSIAGLNLLELRRSGNAAQGTQGLLLIPENGSTAQLSNFVITPSNGSTASSGLLYGGSGVPNIAGAPAGSYYLRTDTPSTSGQSIYVATGTNTWTGVPFPAAPGAFVANTWYPNYAITTGSGLLTIGRIYAYPIIIPVSHTFQNTGTWVTTAGSVSVLRFGIYNDNGGTPVGGSLVLDCGTVNGNTSATAASVAIAQSLSPGVYWLAIVNNSATTASTVQYDTSGRLNGLFGQTSISAAQANDAGFQSTGTSNTGAMPGTFPAATVAGNCPLVLLQA